jgi:hypothetical protein
VTYRQVSCPTPGSAACVGRCEENQQIVGLACSGQTASQTRIIDDPQRPGGKAAECTPGDQVQSFTLVCLGK